MRRTIPLAAFALVISMVGPPPAAVAEQEPSPVVSTPYWDLTPAASSDYLAWSTSRPKDQPLWVQPTDGERFRVNPKGTWAVKPEIDGTLLAYTEGVSTEESYTTDIRFFDLETRAFVEPPEGVNTEQAEWWPSIDGDLLLFEREDVDNRSYEEMLLLDMATGESQVLASSSGWSRYFLPGGIAGGLAVWSRLSFDFKAGWWTSCDVYVHDVATGVTSKLDNPGPKCQFVGSVDAGGTVYYGRAGWGCGRHSQLLGAIPGQEPTVLVSFERGRDFFSIYARDNVDGSTTLYFDPGTCDEYGNIPDADIWSIEI